MFYFNNLSMLNYAEVLRDICKQILIYFILAGIYCNDNESFDVKWLRSIKLKFTMKKQIT